MLSEVRLPGRACVDSKSLGSCRALTAARARQAAADRLFGQKVHRHWVLRAVHRICKRWPAFRASPHTACAELTPPSPWAPVPRATSSRRRSNTSRSPRRRAPRALGSHRERASEKRARKVHGGSQADKRVFADCEGSRKYLKSVRSRRLELPHPCGYQNLNLARLPVPPRPLVPRPA
jgi:hypothetical protein